MAEVLKVPEDIVELNKQVELWIQIRKNSGSLLIKDWCDVRINEVKQVLEERLKFYMEED
ncbi:hypothetical protein NVP1084O_062 [Vibrio phage 1.084.O._10N.261.49.F5]|nr:hypothetical protein NVP1084O_062 [Vibrio phage 1.084.O._10N.261.49.F5]